MHVLAAVALVVASLPSALPEQLQLEPSTSRVYPLSGLTGAESADPAVAQVHALAHGNLFVQGLQEGQTTVALHFGARTEQHRVRVKLPDLSDLVDQVHALDPKLAVTQGKTHLLVEGEVTDPGTFSGLRRLARNTRVKLATDVDPQMLLVLAQQKNAELAAAGFSDAHVTVKRGGLVLEGHVATSADRDRATRIAGGALLDDVRL